MKKLISVVTLTFMLTACGGWGYSGQPTKEVPDGNPNTAIKNPPECFVIVVNKNGFWSTKTYGIGTYCQVPDPTTTTTVKP